MRKGHTREGKISAIIRFFIGICFLLVLLFVGYYLIAIKDYSYMLDDPSASLRSYVAPNATAASTTTVAPDGTQNGDSATPAPAAPSASAAVGAQPASTDAATAPSPTSVPTPTPIPTPTPAPTAIPTRIPELDLSSSRTSGFKVPAASTDGDIGISKCYVSVPDSYQIMQLEGWGFVNQTYFDGRDCATYLIVTQESSGNQIAYLTTSIAGASGREHTSVCLNPDAADFRANIKVANYPDGVYHIGLVLAYKRDGKAAYSYYPFDTAYSFTVLSGEIISPVKTTSTETQE